MRCTPIGSSTSTYREVRLCLECLGTNYDLIESQMKVAYNTDDISELVTRCTLVRVGNAYQAFCNKTCSRQLNQALHQALHQGSNYSFHFPVEVFREFRIVLQDEQRVRCLKRFNNPLQPGYRLGDPTKALHLQDDKIYTTQGRLVADQAEMEYACTNPARTDKHKHDDAHKSDSESDRDTPLPQSANGYKSDNAESDTESERDTALSQPANGYQSGNAESDSNSDNEFYG